MTYSGRMKNGVIVPDEPIPLPEGARVQVFPVESEKVEVGNSDLVADLLELSGIVDNDDLPTDMARNHDHYLHGREKK